MGTTIKRQTSPHSITTTLSEPGQWTGDDDGIPPSYKSKELALAERIDFTMRRPWPQDVPSCVWENRSAPPRARSRTGATEEHWIVQPACSLMYSSSDKRTLRDGSCLFQDSRPARFQPPDVVGGGNPSFMTRMDGDPASTTPEIFRQCKGRRQTNTTPGRLKETVPSSMSASTTPETRILSCQSPPQLIHCGRDEKAAFEALAQFSGGRKAYPVSVLSRPPVSSSPHRFATRKTGMLVAFHLSDVVSLLLGYASTIIIVKSHQHPEDSWWASLPLMEQLPSTLKHPSAPLMACQYTIWCLIGIFHLLRSPRYWPQCGIIAGAVSTATGAWYGAATMIDTVIVTAFLSLVVAKAIDWASERRIRPAGVVLPLSKQDCKDEKIAC